MPLRPDDVVRKSFSMSRLRQGYDVKEVDAFLDEVVEELKGLNTRIDELEAATLRAPEPGPEGDSERVRLERQQLELIRRERADLVEELRALQQQVDAGPQGTFQEAGTNTDGLQSEVETLKAELDSVQRHHHELRERMIESLREQLHLLEAGRDQLPPHEGLPRPPVR